MKYLVKVTTIKVNKLKNLHQELSKDIKWINQRIILYANKSRLERPRLRERNLVYLLRRNIKITRLSDKLDSKKIGLFKIKRNIRDISFEFKFPFIIKIYSIFYISLLEPAYPDIFKGLAPELNPKIQKLVYKIESILAVRRRRNKL
jgi:hypothetical protein